MTSPLQDLINEVPAPFITDASHVHRDRHDSGRVWDFEMWFNRVIKEANRLQANDHILNDREHYKLQNGADIFTCSNGDIDSIIYSPKSRRQSIAIVSPETDMGDSIVHDIGIHVYDALTLVMDGRAKNDPVFLLSGDEFPATIINCDDEETLTIEKRKG